MDLILKINFIWKEIINLIMFRPMLGRVGKRQGGVREA
jgi:hypothetical protein